MDDFVIHKVRVAWNEQMVMLTGWVHWNFELLLKCSEMLRNAYLRWIITCSTGSAYWLTVRFWISLIPQQVSLKVFYVYLEAFSNYWKLSKLRKLKSETNGFGGKGKLIANLIDELSVFYGIAIRRNKDSVKDMNTAIWATLKHKSSTDTNPQHNSCPPGDDSWYTWQKEMAQGKLAEYSHKPALSDDAFSKITPIYEDRSSENLLQRCRRIYAK